MTVDRTQLEATLKQLHDQLEEAESLDAELVQQLRTTTDDIESALERQQETAAPTSLSDRLRDASQHFEQSHPTIAGTLGKLIDMLAQMGI